MTDASPFDESAAALTELQALIQAIEDDVVRAGLAEVERLDRHPLDLETDGIAADRKSEIQILEDLFVADRPAEVGTQRKSDTANHFSHDFPLLNLRRF